MYEARQHKDKVSRRIDNVDGRSRRRINNIIKEILQPKKISFIRDYDKRVMQLTSHPLGDDAAVYDIDVLKKYQAINSKSTLRNLLLEDISFVDDYIAKTGIKQSGGMLLKSLLAIIELHNSGDWYKYFVKSEIRDTTDIPNNVMLLFQTMIAPYRNDEDKDFINNLMLDYGLSEQEIEAIRCYTQPGKDEINGRNYMGQSEKWNPYKNGWDVLDNALKKYPSLEDLGINMTTYRFTRNDNKDIFERIQQLPVGTNILHGAVPIKPYEQGHYMSTSVTYSTSHIINNKDKNLIAFTGNSGKYISPVGDPHWSQDGGEILYSPQIYSVYEGVLKIPENIQGIENIYHFREIDHPEHRQAIKEDFHFNDVREKDPNLDQDKLRLIKNISELNKIKGGIDMIRLRTGISTPVLDASIDELQRIYEEFSNPDSWEQHIINLKMIITLCNQNPDKINKARKDANVYGELMYLSLAEEGRLLNELVKMDQGSDNQIPAPCNSNNNSIRL